MDTEFFSVSHTTHNRTQHHTQTPHGDRDSDRQRQKEDSDREREKRRRKRRVKTRQRKTRQVKRREENHFQCGGAWPFFVGVVIFWLISFAHETLAS